MGVYILVATEFGQVFMRCYEIHVGVTLDVLGNQELLERTWWGVD